MIKRQVFQYTWPAICLVFFLAAGDVYSQKDMSQTKSVDEYLSILPANLKVEKKEPQKYRVTSYWINRDISGNTEGRIRTTAEFARSTKDDQVQCLWNDVRSTRAPGPSEPFPDAELLEEMEGFSYTLSGDIMKETFYKDFPTNDVRNIIKTLIWDAPMIEVIDMSFEKLTYNKTFRPEDFENMTIDMAGFAIIKMKDMRLVWTGLGKETTRCALLFNTSPSRIPYTQIQGP